MFPCLKDSFIPVFIMLIHLPNCGLAFSLLLSGHHRYSSSSRPQLFVCSTATATTSTSRSVPPHMTAFVDGPTKQSLVSDDELSRSVLPFLCPERSRLCSPAESLRRGEWFKLICGASFECLRRIVLLHAPTSTSGEGFEVDTDLPTIRNLALIYTLAGADCVDVAAEEAVIEAARDGIDAACRVAQSLGVRIRAPWLMMSINDDEEDPHFRKAVFDPDLCPAACPRPCEAVCPADAVVFPDSTLVPPQRAAMVAELLANSEGGGVLGPRCYGCGRCINVCPPGIIRAQKYIRSPQIVRELLRRVDAVEIHTKGDLGRFRHVWDESVATAARASLKLVAVSFPDLGADTGLSITAMNAIMERTFDSARWIGDSVDGSLPVAEGRRRELEAGEDSVSFTATAVCGRPLNVWQTDGRPMSGDIGAGATNACLRLAQKVLRTGALPFGEGQHFVQLAGGTNDRTAPKLHELGLVSGSPVPSHIDGGVDQENGEHMHVGGVAYGGFARRIVCSVLDRLPGTGIARVESHPRVLSAALEEASRLVWGLKQPPRSRCL